MSKKPLDCKISVNPTLDDMATIQQIAAAERRRVSDVIRNALEDVVNGHIPLEQEDTGVKRQSTAINVDTAFKERFDLFKKEKNLSADKILHLALQSLVKKENQND